MSNQSKTSTGNFFEDFRVGQEIRHATPRTLTEADAALNIALYGSRFAINSSDDFARTLGLPRAPLDDLLVFHVVIGKTVPDISLNAVANLGYAEFRWGAPVYPGDTLSAHSKVLGLRENSNRGSGVVWVRSTGVNQRGEMVLDYVRWVMVHKRNPEAAVAAPVVPTTAPSVVPSDLIVPAGLSLAAYDDVAAGSPHRWEDYEAGERIDHVSGMTLEDSDHMFSTRLYQNTARVHFDAFAGKDTRFGRRLAYGGHVISLRRRHQCRQPRRADLRRRYDLRLVGSAGEGAASGTRGRGRVASEKHRSQGLPLRDVAGEGSGRQVSSRRRARSRLLAVDAAALGEFRSEIRDLTYG
jgi:2-methylfumaryl-CoA hydratase